MSDLTDTEVQMERTYTGIFIKQPCTMSTFRVTLINYEESFQIWVDKNQNNTPLPGSSSYSDRLLSISSFPMEVLQPNLKHKTGMCIQDSHLQIILSCYPFAAVALVTIFTSMVYFETVSIFAYFCFLKFTHRQYPL